MHTRQMKVIRITIEQKDDQIFRDQFCKAFIITLAAGPVPPEQEITNGENAPLLHVFANYTLFYHFNSTIYQKAIYYFTPNTLNT